MLKNIIYIENKLALGHVRLSIIDIRNIGQINQCFLSLKNGG